jgi:hypothetical protein
VFLQLISEVPVQNSVKLLAGGLPAAPIVPEEGRCL